MCFECWGRGWISGCGQAARAPAHSSAPPVAAENSATTCKQAGHSAAEARRDPGAVSAASQSAAAHVDALPVEVVHVVDVLALAPQLGCAETGRSASIDADRPVSAWPSMRVYEREATACGVGRRAQVRLSGVQGASSVACDLGSVCHIRLPEGACVQVNCQLRTTRAGKWRAGQQDTRLWKPAPCSGVIREV